ncbi:hypothetical protein RRF57_009456 [Xylaria bambusicola]|uniref:Uncharacterized protein n=1 Tax=Xylaria bambusicola TaxID=326684 RepID=A0AAN7ZBZ0_9PEZI
MSSLDTGVLIQRLYVSRLALVEPVDPLAEAHELLDPRRAVEVLHRRRQLGPRRRRRVHAVVVARDVVCRDVLRHARDVEHEARDALHWRPVHALEAAQVRRQCPEVQTACDDGWQPFLLVPEPLFSLRSRDLAHADHGRGEVPGPSHVLEDETANHLAAPVAARREGKVLEASLWQFPGARVPAVASADRRDEDHGDALRRLRRKVADVTDAPDVRLKGLHWDVKVDGPRVVDEPIRRRE